MRFTASLKPLAAMLAPVARIASSRTTIPILSHMLIEAKADGVTLCATDLDKILRASTQAKVTAPGAVTVPAKMLADVVHKLGDGEALFEVIDNQLRIKSGRSRFNLATLPADDFPGFDAGEMPHEFSLDVADLEAMIAAVSYAISTEETRYYLNGIYFHIAPSTGSGQAHLRMTATDGHRLAWREMEAPKGAQKIPGVLLPRGAIGDLTKLCGLGGVAQIRLSGAKAQFAIGDFQLTTKLIDGTFPDYARVVPQYEHALTLDRAALSSALERVTILASERGNAAKLKFSPDLLRLSAHNPDSGSASDEIAIDYAGPPIETGFNATYLLTSLAVFAAHKTVRLHLNDAGSPMAITAADQTTPSAAPQLAIIMPVRV